jgi:hypothetical protein
MKSASVRAASAASPAEPVAKPAVKRPAQSTAKPAAKVPASVAQRSSAKRAAPAASKSVTKAPASVAAAAPPSPEKPPKPAKLRLVRDSFTMPEADVALLAVLKARALGLGRAAKKSELLRAGLQLLNQQDPKVLMASLERLQPIKTGRPKRGD